MTLFCFLAALLFSFFDFWKSRLVQSLIADFCDSLILTKSASEKCLTDGVWDANTGIKINYIATQKKRLFYGIL
ncbi:hypothetical protein C943_03688 [Mariniradius saccharolyticus AK6]|uniref:Uncharacterized protein n=1 Tax=Mariniradius saccharolyticus AK6 TaxID=1239962 RepID=M7XI19_9BACT|nr:hypothetical protein C943_03688 [Mariniradius saccharolyticus AK6]